MEAKVHRAQAMRSRPLLERIAAALVLCWTSVANAQTYAAETNPTNLTVLVLDESQLPVPDARVEIKVGDQLILTAPTNEAGILNFPCKLGRYAVRATKEGFEAAVVQDFECPVNGMANLQLILTPAASKQSIDVHETASVAEVISEPSVTLGRELAKEVPSRPATVSDALPLIPGIARQPSGNLQLSGSGEHRSTMMVNSADVTDPATGAFGLTVPIDSVENINFYQSSVLAEFGRYSTGFVSVETRRGGDEWKWELNDPLPEFFIRSWHLQGLRTATPG